MAEVAGPLEVEEGGGGDPLVGEGAVGDFNFFNCFGHSFTHHQGYLKDDRVQE